MAQQKTKEEAQRARQADRQLQLARERQLKYLYQQGQTLYRQGAYQEAVNTFEQMVVIDPSHELVKAAQRLIAKAEAKLFEERARATAQLSPDMRGALVSELEQRLAEKRMEIETALKYAKSAVQQRHYDMAIQLLQGILSQDPEHRQAQQLLEEAQLARLEDEKQRLIEEVKIDEQRMVNEVLKAQLVTPPASSSGRTLQTRTLTANGSDQDIPQTFQQPVSFDFKDVALTDVLDFLADAANVSVIPSPKLALNDRRVSLRVQDMPLGLALKYLVTNQGLAFRIDQNAVLIASPEEFANEPLETRVFFLRSGLGPFALHTTAAEPNPALEMTSLSTILKEAIPQVPGSKIAVDERSGSLVVTNTAKSLRLVEQLLGQLDIAPVQVLIETRFVEVTLTELEQLGFESVLNGDAALTKKGGKDGTEGPGLQVSKGGGFKFPALTREGEGLNLTLQGVLTGTQFETVLHMLEESQKSKTLSAPKITTLNNQRANIKVVDEFRYPTRYEVSLVQFDVNGDGDFDDAGETEFVNVPQDFQTRDIGLLLNVTPSVGKDLKSITLVLLPEVSQFSQFRDLGGGVTVPEFTSSQLTTSVVIEDGQTVVLGGLMKDTASNQNTKVPILGDIPLVGALFRQTDESQTRKNLLIFVTARILAPRGPTT